MDSYTLTYVDHRPIWLPKLKFYKGGLHLPMKSGDNKIKVTEKERHYLLQMKNGQRPSFTEDSVRQSRRQSSSEEVS